MIYEFVGPTAAPFDRTPSLRALPARRTVSWTFRVDRALILLRKAKRALSSVPSPRSNPRDIADVYDGRNLPACLPSIFSCMLRITYAL